MSEERARYGTEREGVSRCLEPDTLVGTLWCRVCWRPYEVRARDYHRAA